MTIKTFSKLLLVLAMISSLVILYIALSNNYQYIPDKKFVSLYKKTNIVDFSRSITKEQRLNFRTPPTTSGYTYINIVSATPNKHNYLQGRLQSAGRNIIIYVHYKADYISDHILTHSKWEPDLVSQFAAYIKAHHGIQILDIGCNLGVYTLVSSSLGCRVVAVDANPNNTARLLQSLAANNLTANVTVCLNAVGNVRRNVVTLLVPSNIGGSGVIESKNGSNSVKTVFMDDLTFLFDKGKEVAIKMDIETNEIKALQRASKFFDQLNVTMVMIEWEYVKKMKDVGWLMNFFLSRHFKAFTNSEKTKVLKLSNYHSWQHDIFWIK